ncbi:hypothetical protein SDC9_56032 [bioreactor metagenome]|uniref:Uncharacterized protein n=1 Tax=bioreactor metagenome TaxID=1076179 RepID=A0A644X0Q8_9ZZZZ
MKNENEINDEIKSTLEISFCGLLLESSRRYSVLADAVFSFSVEQSNFANKISGQRMTLAKVVVQKQMDFVIALEGEALETYQCHGQMDGTQEMWEDCLSLDEIIMETLEDEGDSWKPVVQGLQNIVQKGEEFAKEITNGRGEAKAWQCLNCGAKINQKDNIGHCSFCEMKENWFIAR